MYNIAVIIGSLRKESVNKKFFLALEKLDHPKLKFNVLNIHDVPLYNQDNDNNLPASVVKFKSEISNADGVLLVTPEYNRSIPGVLKNLIDWGTRPYGQNAWKGKPCAIIGTSPSAVGTAAAQVHLRSVMMPLEVILLGQPEVYFVFKEGLIDENHSITDKNTEKFLQGFLNTFSDWVEKHNKK